MKTKRHYDLLIVSVFLCIALVATCIWTNHYSKNSYDAAVTGTIEMDGQMVPFEAGARVRVFADGDVQILGGEGYVENVDGQITGNTQ